MRLVKNNFIKDKDSTHFHYNQELEKKIYEHLLNKEPLTSIEEFVEHTNA